MKGKKTILLIDDDQLQRDTVLTYLLAENDLELHLAGDGKTGLMLTDKIKPDLILLDWMMPEMDGLEVLRTLKSNKNTTHIPVIMITAKNTAHEVEKVSKLGAAGYLAKPIDIDLLRSRIRSSLTK